MKSRFLILFVLFTSNLAAQQALTSSQYNFSSIEYLIEQEIGRIVLSTIYKNLNFDANINPVPAPRAQFLANSGATDGEIMRIFSYGIDNPNTIRVPTPYYYVETMPFVRKDSKIVISSKEDLKKYKVAIVRGIKHTYHITEHLPQVYETKSTSNMFKLLRKNVVDVAITNTMDGQYFIEHHGFNEIKPMEKPLVTLPLYHYIHKKHIDLVDVIDKEIIRLKDNGDLAQLIKQAELSITKGN